MERTYVKKVKTYFFDRYALIEINKGNKNYNKYKNVKFITTLLNLMEFYYAFLRLIGKNIAEIKFQKYLNNCIPVNSEIIKEATEFRYNFNKTAKIKISYIDAISYIIARKLNIKFLTGDGAFKNLNNVEFVK